MHFFWPTSPSHLCVKLLRRVKVDRLSIYSSGIERAQASVSPPVQMNTDLSTTAHVLSLSLALSTKPTPPLIYRRPGRTQPAGCTMPRRPAWPAAPCWFHFRRCTLPLYPSPLVAALAPPPSPPPPLPPPEPPPHLSFRLRAPLLLEVPPPLARACLRRCVSRSPDPSRPATQQCDVGRASISSVRPSQVKVRPSTEEKGVNCAGSSRW